VVIHPNQVAVVNRTFTATDKEVARGKRIVAACKQAAEIDALHADGTI
jgi:citrate lyase beta subunit